MADDRRYARLSRRLQASCLDVVVAFHTPFAAICFVTWFAGPLAGPLAALLALTPLVLEPILVAHSGMTLGHRLLGLRVVEIVTGRPPGSSRRSGATSPRARVSAHGCRRSSRSRTGIRGSTI